MKSRIMLISVLYVLGVVFVSFAVEALGGVCGRCCPPSLCEDLSAPAAADFVFWTHARKLHGLLIINLG